MLKKGGLSNILLRGVRQLYIEGSFRVSHQHLWGRFTNVTSL